MTSAHYTLFIEVHHKTLAVREDKWSRPSVTVLAKKATTNAKKMHKNKIKVTEELRTNLIGELHKP